MATVRDALNITRTLLNDDDAAIYPDGILMPKLITAHLELQSKIALNGLSVERDASAEVTVLKTVTSMGADMPTNIITPAKMNEKPSGGPDSQFVLMTKVDYIPNVNQDQSLRYWSWRNNTISFLGATTDRVVQLFYTGSLTTPKTVTDDLGLQFAEIFLGARVAAMLFMSLKDFNSMEASQKMAETNLSQVIRTLVKGDEQPLPVRRRPFSFQLRRGRRSFF